MMKRIIQLVLLGIILSSCTSSPEATQTSLLQTEPAPSQSTPSQITDSGEWVLEWVSPTDMSIWMVERHPSASRTARLYISCYEGGMFIVINTDDEVDVDQIDESTKLSKVDAADDVGVLARWAVLVSESELIYYPDDTNAMIPNLLKSRTFRINYQSNGERVNVLFDLAGLNNALLPLSQACGFMIP